MIKVTRTGDAEYGRWVKMLLVGEPGSGKTRTCRNWPNPFYANAEGGLMSVAADRVPNTTITNSAQLQELLRTLQQKPAVREQMLGIPVDTVIIDTFDEVQRIFARERITEQRRESMQRDDWGWLGDQLRAVVRGFRNLDMHVILTCHAKEIQDEQTGRVTVKPMIQGAMGDEIAGYVDLAVLLTARPVNTIENGETVRRIVRVLQTYPDVNHPWIKDRSGKLPMELEINFEDDYKRISGLIFGDLDAMSESVLIREAEAIVQAAPAPVPATKASGPAKKAAPKLLPEPKPEPPKKVEAKVEKVPPPVKPERPVAAPAAGPSNADVIAALRAQLAEAEAAAKVKEPARKSAEAVAPEIAPEPAPAPPEESVPENGTASGAGACEVCGKPIENQDQSDLSWIRFRKRMCREDFAAAKKR